MMTQTNDSNNTYVNEIKQLAYTGPIKGDGKPDKRSKEWKQYIKRKNELESKIEVQNYLKQQYELYGENSNPDQQIENNECNKEQLNNSETVEENNKQGLEENNEQGLEENNEQGLETSEQELEENNEQGLETSEQELEENNEQGLEENNKQGLEENNEQGLETSEQELEENNEQGLETSEQDLEENNEQGLETSEQDLEENNEQGLETSEQDLEENNEQGLETSEQGLEENNEQGLEETSEQELETSQLLEENNEQELETSQLLEENNEQELETSEILEEDNEQELQDSEKGESEISEESYQGENFENNSNNTVKDKILKLFLETPKKDFLNLINSVDKSNYGLLLSQLIEDYLDLSKMSKIKESEMISKIEDLQDENKELRNQLIKYCFPKVLTAKFCDLNLSNNRISFNYINKWQLIDKNNSKYIKIRGEDLFNDWETIFTSKPYITIMYETEDNNQRVFILNKTFIDKKKDKNTEIVYEQGMVQHRRSLPLVDIEEQYTIDKGIICIHT
jgi:hypothetical protein